MRARGADLPATGVAGSPRENFDYMSVTFQDVVLCVATPHKQRKPGRSKPEAKPIANVDSWDHRICTCDRLQHHELESVPVSR